MKKIISILTILFLYNQCYAQNVGIGTNSPTEKLDIIGNINLTGTLKANGISGLNGEVLSSTGLGLVWAKGIYTLNASNYLNTVVPASNYVRIDGSITLMNDYSGLNSSKLFIIGGSINGNGTTKLNLYVNTIINGVYFSDVDINGSNLTFINCSFTGNCPRLGYNNTFINCQISGVSILNSSIALLEKCDVQNSTLANVGRIINSELNLCTLGEVSLTQISNSLITNSNLYIISDLDFSNNVVKNSKLTIGNFTSSPNSVTIVNNKFNSIYAGTSEVIEILPNSPYYKMYTINSNNFEMQSSDFSSIRIVGPEGNSLGYSSVTIQNNTFHRGSNTLYYTGNMKVNYSNNTINPAGGTATHPGVSGNLQVSNNITF